MAAGDPGGGDQWSVWPSSPPQRGELERRRTKEQLKRVSLQSGYRRGAPGRGSEQVSPPPFSSAHPFPPAPPPNAPFPGPLGSSSLVTGGAQGWPLHLGGERDQPGVPPRGTHPLDFAYLLETRSPGIYSLRSS